MQKHPEQAYVSERVLPCHLLAGEPLRWTAEWKQTGKWSQRTDREDERKQEVPVRETGWGCHRHAHPRHGRAMQERLAQQKLRDTRTTSGPREATVHHVVLAGTKV